MASPQVSLASSSASMVKRSSPSSVKKHDNAVQHICRYLRRKHVSQQSFSKEDREVARSRRAFLNELSESLASRSHCLHQHFQGIWEAFVSQAQQRAELNNISFSYLDSVLNSLYTSFPSGIKDVISGGKVIAVSRSTSVSMQHVGSVSRWPKRFVINRGISARSVFRRARASLLPSATTLIVVPPALIEHWRQQIERHVHGDLCGSVRRQGFKRKHRDGKTRGEEMGRLRKEWDVCGVYIDSLGIREDRADPQWLPSPEELRRNLIVVVSYRRLTLEAMREKREKQKAHSSFVSKPALSSLRRIVFTRIVVDEGHTVGRSIRTEHAHFLSSLNAGSRWILTGTPVALSKPREDVKVLEAMLKFLHPTLFSATAAAGRDSSDIFRRLVGNPVVRGCCGGMRRASDTLARIMLQHTKKEVGRLLPRLSRKTVLLQPSPIERSTYNTLVSVVQMNLLTTSIGDSNEGWGVSLLNPKNRKMMLETMLNLRLSCVGGGPQIVELEPMATQEVANEMRRYWEAHQMKKENLVLNGIDVEHKVAKAVKFVQELGESKPFSCVCGMEGLLLRYLGPCGHAFCAECVTATNLHCPWCKFGPFDADRWAFLQPGTKVHWMETLTERLHKIRGRAVTTQQRRLSTSPIFREGFREGEKYHGQSHRQESACADSRKPSSLSLPFMANRAVIEDSTYMLELSQKAHYVIQEIKALLARRKGKSISTKCLIYSSMRKCLDLVGTSLIHTFGKNAVGEFYSSRNQLELRKFTHDEVLTWRCDKCGAGDGFENDWSSDRCQRELVHIITDDGRNGSTAHTVMPKDVLDGDFLGRVISIGQRVSWSSRLGDQTEAREGTVVKARRCSVRRPRNVLPIRQKVRCHVLLLTREGSHGLDLSMVERVFLIDKIWNPAEEEQVIARAWRIGSKRAEVRVEQLLLKGTLEEMVHAMPSARPSNISAEVMKGLRYIRPERGRSKREARR